MSQPTGLTADITAKNLTINGAVANNKQYDGAPPRRWTLRVRLWWE